MGRNSKGRASARDKSDGDDEDYRKRRDRNNQAVKKSRFKSKQKTQETQDRISALKNQNDKLEDDVKRKSSELSILKELFIAKCTNTGMQFSDTDLEKLLEEDDPDEGETSAKSSKES